MDLQLTGKRALVTGGTRGIGKAIAAALAAEGCDVAVAGRDAAALAATAAELAAGSGRAVVPIVVDTGDDASVEAMVTSCVAQLGGLDILVNNAAKALGQAAPPRLADITSELFWDDVNVKVMGYLRCAREVAPHMTAQGWGRIVNVSGLAARNAGSIVGSVRNVSVAALTKVLADELGPSGINVTVVHPGATRTETTTGAMAARAATLGITVEELEAQWEERTSLRRIITAEEVADVVTFLASPRSVAITGDTIACAGGMPGAIYY